jgi:hypothetical protein
MSREVSREILDPEGAKLVCDVRIPYDVALVISDRYLIPITPLLMALRRCGIRGLSDNSLGNGKPCQS